MAAFCHKKGDQVLSFMWQRDADIVQRIIDSITLRPVNNSPFHQHMTHNDLLCHYHILFVLWNPTTALL